MVMNVCDCLHEHGHHRLICLNVWEIGGVDLLE